MAEFTTEPLRDAWRRAAGDLKDEIGRLALEAADRAQGRIRDAYPERSGELRRRVITRPPRGWTKSEGATVPARVVAATAPHVHFVEKGIAGRKRIPPRETFVPIAVEERQAYLQRAQALLQADRRVI